VKFKILFLVWLSNKQNTISDTVKKCQILQTYYKKLKLNNSKYLLQYLTLFYLKTFK